MKNLLSAAALLLCLFLNSCTKSTTIGDDLFNEDAFPESVVIDTLTMEVNTFIADSIQTAPPVSGIPYLLGAINDEVTGKFQIGIFSQLIIPTNNINLGDSLQLDSIVLTLRYTNKSIYGDAEAPVSLSVYELTESMQAGNTYYSNKQFAYHPMPIGHLSNYYFSPTDSLTIFSKILKDQNDADSIVYVKTEPHIRIPLSRDFGNRLLSQSGTINLADNSSFRQFFKGIYIEPSSNMNSVAYIDMLGARSRLTLYYKQGNRQNLTLDLPVSALSAISNYFKHNYSNSEVQAALSLPKPNGQQVAYIEGAAGLGFSINFPHLNTLSNYAVNKAELEFTVLPNSFERYELPGTLALVTYDTTTNKITRSITTAVLAEEDGVNGEKLSKYKFVFSFYTQQKITGVVQNAIEQALVELQRSNPNRLVIGGPEHPQYPMKFSLICTQLQ